MAQLTNELLQDKELLTATLKNAIVVEAKRILDNGLAKKAELEEYMKNNNLPDIYTALSNLKIAGDKLENKSVDFMEVLEKALEKYEEVVEEEENENDDHKSKQVVMKIVKLEEKVAEELEKIAYNVGRTGDHETAYIIEKTIKEIKGE